MKLKSVKSSKPNQKLPTPDETVFQQKLQTTGPPPVGRESNETWKGIKTWIVSAVNETTKSIKIRKKHWMTKRTTDLIESRRQQVNSTVSPEYKKVLDKEIQRACREDKNEHIKRVCEKLEEHATNNRPQELYNSVKYLSREFKPQTQIIKNENGETITDANSIAEVWRQHCEKLFNDHDTAENYEPGFSQIEKEPSILRAEVEKAIRSLKNNKSPGEDGITAEVIKAMGELGIDTIQRLCDMIWQTGEWPTEWCASIYMPLHKKGSPKDCNNYRTIALMSHASKILLHIICNRLKPFLLPQIPEEQTGFMPGKGTREQILNVRQIIEKAYEFNVKTYLCFVDYRKAFDCVKWKKMWLVLENMGVPKHLIVLLKNLYEGSCGKVKVNNILSNPFQLKSGVRQGCIVSPMLFNIYGEHLMREVLQGWKGGIKIGGRRITNLRYADDTLILAGSEEELVRIITKLDRISREYGLTLNRNKTQVMIIHRSPSNIKKIADFEVVEKINYLGSIITNKGGCEEEIKRRLAIARNATIKLTRIWRDSSISQHNKLRLLKTLIFPIATYASETWTLKSANRRKIDAFEMWTYRRMLRISYTEHRTNISIVKQLKVNTRLSTRINQSYLGYFGHISRRTEGLEKLIVEGKIDGKRPRGRSPTRWVDQAREIIGHGLHEVCLAARDREGWRTTIRAIET